MLYLCCTNKGNENRIITMFHVKIVIRQKKNKDGLMPLAIRITKDRKTSFIHIANILEKDWDTETQRVRKSHTNSARLNNLLLTKLSEANNKALEMETQTNVVSSRAVKQKIKPSAGSTFFAQAEVYLNNLKSSGKYNQYTSNKPCVKHFREFLKGDDVAFSDITIAMLNRYQAYLKNVQKVSATTIVNHLVVIRSVFSQAIKEEITDQKYYPFGRGKVRLKAPASLKIGLSPEEVKQLEDAILTKGSLADHSRNVFLFSFYFAGMRISDVLRMKWSDFQNDRLYYSMGKNAKGGSLKVPEKVAMILSRYEDKKTAFDGLIFPDLKTLPNLDDTFAVQKRISGSVSRIDRSLKTEVAPAAKITKKLTMHIARHTFGNISGERIPIQMLQKLYRHSSITTTIGYQANFIHKDADEALAAVIGA
jgi:integrase/recombinase XerD